GNRLLLVSSLKASGMLFRAGAGYGSKIPALSARLRKVLSTPKNTSASGLSLLMIALFSAAPASPDFRIWTVAPDCYSNALGPTSLTLKLSWVMTISFSPAADGALVAAGTLVGCGAPVAAGALVGVPPLGWPPHAANSRPNTIDRIKPLRIVNLLWPISKT